MNMQYRQPAQSLAGLGRGPDTELVHMAPSEVQSLQNLAQGMGGSLSTNPNTGLPEAGFLKNILPMVIGAGLSFIPGVGPLAAGALMGGGALAASGGDLKEVAKWGLGGASGAGLAGSLAGAGAGVQAGAATTGAAGTTNAANAARGGMSQLTDIGKALADPSKLTSAASGFMTQPFAKSQLYSGLGSLAAGTEIDKMNQNPPTENIKQQDLAYYPQGGYTYDASGNVVQENSNARNKFNRDGFYDYGAGFPMAQGGLIGFADGGLTVGPGDGMSDEIMTTISGEQPAALSPGEFVVPADVVSGLGNGSTQAGANALDDMMERVRKARGGSALQPPALNAQDMMPA
tara:strand:- start:1004 stop:2041 length:1038 start_codon:yes stop_codon:yes gene_type:complete